MVRDWNPIDDFAETDFSDLLQGDSLLEIAINEAARYWPGMLKSAVRGGSAGLLIGGLLSYATDYPADKGATYGLLLFGIADAVQHDARYRWHVIREFLK